jgi:aspartate 1-decarboxylase
MSVTGKRSELMQVVRKAAAYVDVSEIDHADEYTLDIKIEMPTGSVKITKQKMKSLDVTVEPVITKEVPVVIRQTDKNKTYIVKSTPQQETLTLTGAQSLLENVSCIMSAVSVIDMKEDNVQKYSYRIMDLNNSEVDDKKSFKTDVTSILVYNELYTPTVMNVDVTIPDTVSSMYDVDILQSLTVTAGIKECAPERLTATFPENAITDVGSADYIVTVDDTDNVYIEEDDAKLKVRAVVTKKELQYVQIPVRFKNVPDGYRASCDTPAIDTYINCVPSRLTSSELVAYADVSGLSEGVHEVTLEFEQTKAVKVIGEYRVNVMLSKEK